MKKLNRNFKTWLAKHQNVDMWLNRAAIWVLFAAMTAGRR